MFIKQLYTGCLSEAAYYIESNGQAAIIDPLRDIEEYLHLAAERNASIKYIFETHFHADFVSGHLDLAKATGAPIVYGPYTETHFQIHQARDGECFQLGDIKVEVLHTPGHTLESSCFLVRDEHDKPHAVFTGDTLFVGDVGRPDLSSGNLTKEELAGMLHESLQKKIMPLPEEVIIYPAHGAGSSCGKNLGPGTYSTLAEEKENNYALRCDSKEEFVRCVTEGLSAPPQYFPINAKINQEGYNSLDEILEQGLKPMGTQELKELMQSEEVIILDTRQETIFSKGFVPRSVNIGLDGRFAEWAGSLLPFDKTLVLITEKGKEKESIVRLARVGFHRIKGHLKDGFGAWEQSGQEIDMIIDVEVDELAMDLRFDKNLVVVDVRRETEFADGHVLGSVNIPLNEMNDPASMASLDENQNLYLHCGSGYRSIIAASLLKRQGLHNLRNVLGGWSKIREQQQIETTKEKSVLN